MPLKNIGVPLDWSSSSSVKGRYNGTISTECPWRRRARTSALSRKQFPQYMAPAPGVIWMMFNLSASGPVSSFGNHFFRSRQGLANRQVVRQRHEFGNPFPQFREILVHVTGEA